MLQLLARNWWLLLLRGICAIAFGIMAFAWPGLTVLVLVTLFGIYALIDGIVALGAAITARGGGTLTLWLILVGVLGIAAAIFAFAQPGITAMALLVMIACWAIVRGIFEIVGAIQLRKHIDNEWMLIVGGVMSVLFGVVLLLRPRVGAVAMVWLIGTFAIIYGLVAIGLSLRLRRVHEGLGHGPVVARA